MTRKFKATLSMLLCAVMVLCSVAVGGMFASAETVSGTCGAEGDGSNLTWTFDTATGELIISGKGAMADFYGGDNPPWSATQLNDKQGGFEIKKLTINDGVTSIGAYAFSSKMSQKIDGDSSFTSITIPDSVTSIGHEAFSFCESLTDITLSKNLTSIGQRAFINTGYYNNDENWNSNVLYIGNNLIDAKDTISGDYKTNENTKIIADYAFSDCKSLTSITITDNVTSIGKSAFVACTSLSSVTIPKGVTSIGDNAFYGCTSLKKIIVENQNSSYLSEDGVLFNKDKTVLIKYPEAKAETSYSVPSTVTEIGEYAFYNCVNLENITIPNSVNTIGNGAFYCAAKLTSIIIPSSVTDIESDAFSKCTGLTSVAILGNITKISPYMFYYSTNLEDIIIPESVESIGYCAFLNCKALKSITIGKKLTSVDSEAFNGCDSLKDVFYKGSESDWNNIFFGNLNGKLTNAAIHYNFTGHNFINGVCSICGYVCTHDCKPTCTESAICSICNKTLSATGHNYASLFTWQVDNSATVTFTCENDNEHKLTYNCKVSSEITKAATCTETGEITYTATYTLDGKEYNCKKKGTISATGHTFDADGKCTVNGCDYVCDHTKNTNKAICEKSAVCSVCKKELPKLGHDFSGSPAETKATFFKDGSKVYHCTHDGCTETRTEITLSTINRILAWFRNIFSFKF